MTLEQYYIEEKKIELNEPKNASWSEIFSFYRAEIDKLRSKLPKKVLDKVLENERRFYDKMQSPYN